MAKYSVKNAAGEDVVVDDATRQELLDAGKRTAADFAPVSGTDNSGADFTIMSGPAQILTPEDSLDQGLITTEEYAKIRADEEAKANAAPPPPGPLDAPTPSLAEESFPSTVAASQNDVPWPKYVYAAGSDLASLPLRAIAGAGAGAGTLAGGGSASDALKALALTTKDPVAMAEADARTNGDPGYGSKLAAIGAASAANPTTLPLLLMGGGPAAQAIKAATLMYGNDVARKGTEPGGGWGDFIPNTPEAQSYALPAVLAALPPAARFLTQDLSPALRQKAIQLLTSQIKPAQYAKGGAEAEGLAAGLQGRALGAPARPGDVPLLPKIVDYTTRTVPQVAENFQTRVMNPVQEKFQPLLRNMDQTQAQMEAGWNQHWSTVPDNPEADIETQFAQALPTRPSAADALTAAQKSLKEARAAKSPLIDKSETDAAMKWLKSRLLQPNTPEGLDAFDAKNEAMRDIAAGKVHPVADDMGIGLTYRHPNGFSYSPTLPSGYKTYRTTSGPLHVPVNPKELQMEGIWTGPDKQVSGVVENGMEHTDLPYSIAHNAKSAINKEIYKNNQDVNTAREFGGHAVGQNLRQQILQKAPVPEGFENYAPLEKLNMLKERYADLMKESAPAYAMQDAMERASARENRLPISLARLMGGAAFAAGKNMMGGGLALGSALQEHPGTARALWDLGDLSAAFTKSRFGQSAAGPVAGGVARSVVSPGNVRAATAVLASKSKKRQR